jgi:hypothetical protein
MVHIYLTFRPLKVNEYKPVGGMIIGRGNLGTKRKPTTVPLHPPKIPYDLTYDEI